MEQRQRRDAGRELGRAAVEIWDQNADFWDQRMGEGNDFHKRLIEPSQLRLLELRGGETILDVACGNGQFARKMADLGARVTAVDASERMIDRARRRSADYKGRIEYRVLDCVDREGFLSLGTQRFDRVVCTMALMDIAEIEPLICVSARLLTPGGCFVGSLCHPCFNSGFAKHGVERHDLGGELVEEYYIRVCRYGEPHTTKGVAMQGQPVSQYYFHRPISMLLNAFFAHGFVLDGIEEPMFEPSAATNQLFETVFQQNPPALVFRMRLPQ
jgi:SAM-dependent methyltransferase